MENILWFNGLTMKTVVANKAPNIKILDDESVTSTTPPKSFQNIVLAEISKVFENAKEQIQMEVTPQQICLCVYQ